VPSTFKTSIDITKKRNDHNQDASSLREPKTLMPNPFTYF
jgi:hypothetical protein